MKSEPSSQKHRASNYLVTCLAALVAVSTPALRAADTDTTTTQKKTTTTTTTTTTTPAPAAVAADEGVQTMSKFTVNSDKDYGYLKTNAATATRIGMEIQKVPMNISVISQEFMQDTDLKSTNDIFKYLASTSGDAQFEADRPSNNPTPQGNNRLRGFPVNIILRNGVFLYSVKSITDFVDRIEVIKGPAAVFFGQGYPGGVINYITKKAEFGKIPTTLRYVVGANKQNHLTLDTNQVLSDKAALRVVGGWENSKGELNFSYTKRFDTDVSLVLKPLKNDKLVITSEVSHLKEHYNTPNQFAWIFPDQYFKDYNNPSAALIAAAGVANADQFRNSINANLGGWMADVRKVSGDPLQPLYTSVKRGGYYTDASGKYIHDDHFNFYNRGSYIDNESTIAEFTVESKITDWLDGRYVYTRDNTQFYDREGYWYPYADQIHFQLVGGGGSGYFRKTDTHQVDLIFHHDTDFITPMKHKLLAGYLFDKYLQQYWAPIGGAIYVNVPGFNAGGTDASMGVIPGELGNVPPTQVIYDRNGIIKTPAQVYSMWDPGAEIQPEAGNKIFPIDRNALDGYSNQDNAWYVNYQMSALQDRLNVLAGFRQETYRQSGQRLTSNFPWYAPGPYAWTEPNKYPPAAYNYSVSYASSNFLTQTGDSWMGGVSFEIMKNVNVYATVSKTFHYNGNSPLGSYNAYITDFPGNDETTQLTGLFTATLAAYASIGKPLIYTFADGSTRTITSVADGFKAIGDAGAARLAKNEVGMNHEIGVKTSLWDGKLTATFSLFQADRSNQRKEDGYHQSIDVFNFNYNPIINPVTGANVSPNGNRHFRWYSNDAHDRTQGTDFEVIWTPIRNFQSYIAGSWIWTAKTVSDPTVQPGNINYDLYFNTRLEFTPEYELKTFNKYTFTNGPISGASIGLGIRYASATNIGRNNSWNIKEGGLTGADYVVYDLTLGYPYEISGYKLYSQLGVYNLTDKVYTDGSYVLAPPRYWTLSTTLNF